MKPPVAGAGVEGADALDGDGEAVERGVELLAAPADEAGPGPVTSTGSWGATMRAALVAGAPATVTRPASMAARACWRLAARPRRTSSASSRRRVVAVASPGQRGVVPDGPPGDLLAPDALRAGAFRVAALAGALAREADALARDPEAFAGELALRADAFVAEAFAGDSPCGPAPSWRTTCRRLGGRRRRLLGEDEPAFLAGAFDAGAFVDVAAFLVDAFLAGAVFVAALAEDVAFLAGAFLAEAFADEPAFLAGALVAALRAGEAARAADEPASTARWSGRWSRCPPSRSTSCRARRGRWRSGWRAG